MAIRSSRAWTLSGKNRENFVRVRIIHMCATLGTRRYLDPRFARVRNATARSPTILFSQWQRAHPESLHRNALRVKRDVCATEVAASLRISPTDVAESQTINAASRISAR